MISAESKKWFYKFWRYVKAGSYQQFVRDLLRSRTKDEVSKINRSIREVYLELIRSDSRFRDLGRISLSDNDSNVIVENDSILKQAIPTFSRLIIGNHGPYIEFTRPADVGRYVKHCKQYVWFEKDFAKYYSQVERVNYADYQPWSWYVSLYEAFGYTDPDYFEKIREYEDLMVNNVV